MPREPILSSSPSLDSGIPSPSSLPSDICVPIIDRGCTDIGIPTFGPIITVSGQLPPHHSRHTIARTGTRRQSGTTNLISSMTSQQLTSTQPPPIVPSPSETTTPSLSADTGTIITSSQGPNGVTPMVLSTISFSPSPTEVPPGPTPASTSKSSPVFAIIGSVVGGVILLLCLLAVLRYYLKRKAEKKRFRDDGWEHQEAKLWAGGTRSNASAQPEGLDVAFAVAAPLPQTARTQFS